MENNFTGKFNETLLEEAIIELIYKKGISHVPGKKLAIDQKQILIKEDLINFLKTEYADSKITLSEIEYIIHSLEQKSCFDLYESNKFIMDIISNGFLLKRHDRDKKDIYVNLIDYSENDKNIYKIVNQKEILGKELRKPDCILFINGIPLVVLEFKSAIRTKATIYDAYRQITIRYKRDIPELFKYNAFCIISDGVNNKVGSFFSPYEFYYSWRKVTGNEIDDLQGIDTLYSMINGIFDRIRMRDIIKNFIFFPDVSRKNLKVFCRYPQYYAARKLYKNILNSLKPQGDGRGGTYFGATGSGKSFTMLFLTRLLMKSNQLTSPTILLITDRTDLDDQLSEQFLNAKKFIGDENVISVEKRAELGEFLRNRKSGGVFLTTVQKFTEDINLLSDRNNIICISDEAHRTQTNLEQKVKFSESGLNISFGFANYLHRALPNATYVGFTGTPIDATFHVFGDIVDSYTMKESVDDEITVPIVYEGRAANILVDNEKLREIDAYYEKCSLEGSSDLAIEESKNANSKINSILGDPDRLKAIALDFVEHYERRIEEGLTGDGKAIFVCNSRTIAYQLYQQIISIRNDWAEIRNPKLENDSNKQNSSDIKPIEKIKMVMTRDKDDDENLYNLLGDKKYRKELDRQFKEIRSNFKIAIVVDMWLTGFDVPSLDTIYIDKPLQKHSLIQTISRVNRKYGQKKKGLIVDYIGIKKQMNLALAHYSKPDVNNFEDITKSILIFKNHLEILNKIFKTFNFQPYLFGTPLEKLECLNNAVEFIQKSLKTESHFINLVNILKTAYEICCANNEITVDEKNFTYFYISVRSILFKLTKGDAPDTAKMNIKVQSMVEEAIISSGVEPIFKIDDNQENEFNIFDNDYLEKIEKIKLPNTKIKLLEKLLSRGISSLRKKNIVRAKDFSEKFENILKKYNDRDETNILRSEVLDDFSNEIIDLYNSIKVDFKDGFNNKEIFEERAFYEILESLAKKYGFKYPENKLKKLSHEVKNIVDRKSEYIDWNNREDIKAELKVDLIILLANYDYPPVDRDEVYYQILSQAIESKLS